MKKSLVLAMAMALGVTASAYAANPFSDVPAGHWAYDSIDKLAAAGVIDGMGDGTYQGDKTMTRYEMAQIVAKAMAKGANVDKLAAEFADELDNLGVRVANLEKKADNVKITGTVSMLSNAVHGDQYKGNSYNYEDYKNDTNKVRYAHKYILRSDLNIKGQINEDWTYSAMLRNEQYLDHDAAGKGEEDTRFQRAWVDGKIGGVKVKAGRHNKGLVRGEMYSSRVDGIEAAYKFGKVNLNLGYAQLSSSNGASSQGAENKVMYAEAKAQLNKMVGLEVDYVKVKDAVGVEKKTTAGDLDGDFNVWGVGLDLNLSKNVKVAATYLHSDADKEYRGAQDKDGLTVKASYKGASAAKPGSWGLYAKYVDLPKSVNIEGGSYSTNSVLSSGGFEGMIYGANYAFAKNIVGTVEFDSFRKIASKDKKTETLFAGVAFTF